MIWYETRKNIDGKGNQGSLNNSGDPRSGIVSKVEEMKVDILKGSQGMGAVERAPLGSVVTTALSLLCYCTKDEEWGNTLL
jgi:hypothetical protein